jgi:hypothetical protein
MMIAGFVLPEFSPDQTRNLIEKRTIHQYKFRQVSRIVVTLRGIIREIEVLSKPQPSATAHIRR